ncbi:MAG: DUF4230 domain-containing protein [Candidatus Fermentibacter sp.]|nr:DUF4230 domain-containing protein [Candidatus Fermentibacter sp.]
MNGSDMHRPGGRGDRAAGLRGRLVPLAVITASIAVLGYVVLDRTGALEPRRIEAGPEYVEAVRGLNLLELTEYECNLTISRTITDPLWDRLPLEELDCELEIGSYYSVCVTAGIDMSGASGDFIRIDGRRADVTLPSPEIVNTVPREVGTPWIVTEGPPRSWDEELLEARGEMAVEAGEEAREDALAAGIIQRAESVATAQVSQALSSFGMEETHVRFE